MFIPNFLMVDGTIYLVLRRNAPEAPQEYSFECGV